MRLHGGERAALGGVEEAGRVTALGRDLRDALAHRPRPEDGHVQRYRHGLVFPGSALIRQCSFALWVAAREHSRSRRWRGFSWSTTARARVRSSAFACATRGTTSRRSLTPPTPPRWRSTSRPTPWSPICGCPASPGLQLCRLLRAEPATAHVPVVLLTASDDRRSRFWARHAGATAYVTKTEIDRLTDVLGDLTSSPKTRPPPGDRTRRSSRAATSRSGSRSSSTSRSSSRPSPARSARSRRRPRSSSSSSRASARSRPTSPAIAGSRSRPTARPRRTSSTRRGSSSTRTPDLKEAAEREARDALDVAPPPERRKPDEGDAFVIADKRAVEAEWSTPPDPAARAVRQRADGADRVRTEPPRRLARRSPPHRA